MVEESIRAPGCIQVSVLDDEKLVLAGMVSLINAAEGLELACAHTSSSSTVADVLTYTPQVLVMDIQLTQASGLEWILQVKRTRPDVNIIVLTSCEVDEMIYESIRAGVNGYLLKRSPQLEIVDAIRDVHQGGSPMTSSIVRKLTKFVREEPAHAPETAAVASLSPRETEVMTHLAQGFRYKEIAEHLDISIETVRTHLHRTYEKLQVTSRTEAAVKFLKG